MRYLFQFLFISFIIISACNSYKEKVERILEKAGQNRNELEKVINHYKEVGDKEKLKATYFLIGDMNEKYGRYGDIVNSYYPIFNTLDSLKRKKVDDDTINNIIKNLWTKYEKKYGTITNTNYPVYFDYQVINAEYLIENIDYAFKAWKEKPWAQHLNFDQFCEFILPYRIFDEPLQFYRKKFYEEYSWVEDSIKNKSDPLEVCSKLNVYLARKFNFCSKLDKCPILGVNDLDKLHGGICEHRYLLVADILRSIGIPICIDFAPQFNNNAIGHSWLVTIDKKNKFVPFNGGEPGITISDTVKFPIVGVYGATKVFRYSYDEKSIDIPQKFYANLIPGFQNKYIQDVSNQYKYSQMDIKFDMPENSDKSQLVYICSFGYGLNIIPTYYTIPSSNQATFKYIGDSCAYFFSNIDYENQYKILSNPIYLQNNSIIRLNPDLSKKREIRLTRKFLPAQYIFRMYEYASWLKGAKFQAANDRSFSNAVTIYEIDRNDYLSFTEKEVNSDKTYRYYRFISSDTGKIRIAELGFVQNGMKDRNIFDKSKIFGYYKNQSDKRSIPVFPNAFDKNIGTNLNAPPGSWVAVDFGTPVKLSKVQFLIRNDLNAVEIGDTYELFYFNLGWVSLGKKIADKNYLIYDDVPENALLLLRDLSKGHEERIFLYKEDKQIWL